MEGNSNGERDPAEGPANGAGETTPPAKSESRPTSIEKTPSWWPAGELTVARAKQVSISGWVRPTKKKA